MYWILQVDGCWYQHMCCRVRVQMRFWSRRREVDGLWRVNVETNWQVDSWNLNWSLWNFQQMNEQCTDVQAFVGKDLWKLLFPFTLLGTSMELFSPEKSSLSRWFSKLPVWWDSWYYCWWKKSCTTKDDDYPIIYRVLTIPGGAGFLPSTVVPWRVHLSPRHLFG